MRNLPKVNTITDDKTNRADSIDLKHWQSKANSEDLHALYSGEVTNLTHFQFHDLMFHVHYSDKSARFFRRELITSFRELVAGTVLVEDIREKAKALTVITQIAEKARKTTLSD